ncbi:PEP/pyruvate-binding domain-containing protein, partial [Romboutsia sp.]|uniref:PEP/pyruvate-binding domain-containing protein n=1 Tax=Romboutsia sp. TaxID=1965302 RepID=UPI002BB81285
MFKSILYIDEIKEDSFNLVGGKGYNLGKMIQNKFPVPNGFCITTLAFSEFIKNIKNENVFIDLENTNFDDLNNIDKLCFKIRKLITSKLIDENLENEINIALNKIGKEKFYAVRSSATAEDLENMSFAGQQDTYLNTQGINCIKENIKKCWASLYTQRAVIYRKKNKIKEEDVSICVVIQEMIDAKKSGIMFSADPLTNSYNNITIDAGFGLGEALVSGLITPDLYKYHKVENKIIYKEVNKKEIAIYRNKGGGTQQVILDENQKTTQVLSDNEIKQLSNMAKDIETYYNSPQDIEWAINEEGKIYILQSRPITSLYPKINKIDNEERIYISFNHIQVMTDPIRPLGIDLFKNILPFVSVQDAGGRIYIDITPVIKLPIRNKIIEKLIPNVDFLMADALKNYVDKYSISKKLPSTKVIKQVKNVVLPVIKTSRKNYKENIKPDSQAIVKKFIKHFTVDIDNEINKSESLIEKIKKIQEIGPSMFPSVLQNIMPYIAPGIISYKKLLPLLEKNNIDTNLCEKVVSGIEGNITTEMGLMVGDLSDSIRNDTYLIKILETNPKNAHKKIIQQSEDNVRKIFEKFLSIYGMRGIKEIDFTNERYIEDFTPISISVLNNIKTLKEKEHRENYNKLIAESIISENKILKTLKEKGNKRDLDKAQNYIKNIRCFLSMREHGKYALMKIFNIFRNVFKEVGEHLEEKMLLDSKEDIYYLTIDEIKDILLNKKNYKKVIDSRKEAYELYEKLTPPRVINSDGEIFKGNYNKGDIPKDALVATSVSCGIYEGYARVILNPTDDNLKKGEILVTKFTDPGWTPLFIN